MKKIYNWWLPENDKHLEDKLKEQSVVNRGYDYQTQQRDYAILLNKKYKRRNRLAIDIGAHVGLWAIDLSNNFDMVQTFEPVTEFRNCLFKNIEENKIENIVVNEVALGNENKEVNMAIDETNTGATHIGNKHNNYIVKMKKLDDYNFKLVDFIKIDTEGYELQVLKGAKQTLIDYKPMIVVEMKEKNLAEFNVSPGDIDAYLRGLGYLLDNVVNSEYIYVHKDIPQREYKI